MPLFQYKGRNQHGEAVAGRLEAASADAVASQLVTRGVIPVDVTLARAGHRYGVASSTWRHGDTRPSIR